MPSDKSPRLCSSFGIRLSLILPFVYHTAIPQALLQRFIRYSLTEEKTCVENCRSPYLLLLCPVLLRSSLSPPITGHNGAARILTASVTKRIYPSNGQPKRALPGSCRWWPGAVRRLSSGATPSS